MLLPSKIGQRKSCNMYNKVSLGKFQTSFAVHRCLWSWYSMDFNFYAALDTLISAVSLCSGSTSTFQIFARSVSC